MRPCLILLASLMASLLPGAAGAHAILLDSQPPARGAVAPGATGISLRFNSRIDAGRSRVVLRTEGQDRVLALAPSGAGDVLTARADLGPGEYVLRWQVLAVDGHITRGDVPFTVRAGTVEPGTIGAGKAEPGMAAAQVRAP